MLNSVECLVASTVIKNSRIFASLKNGIIIQTGNKTGRIRPVLFTYCLGEELPCQASGGWSNESK